MPKLRVLFVTHTVAMAGANRSMLQLITELRDDFNVEPVVLMPKVPVYYAKWNLFKACEQQNIECLSYRFYWFKDKKRWFLFLLCLTNLFLFPYISFKMRGKRFDLIHSNGSVFSLGAFLSRIKRCPHVWHLREFGNLDYDLVPLMGKRYEHWVYKYGDVFVAISKAIKTYYSNIIPSSKIVLVYNGILLPDTVEIAMHQNMKVQFCIVGLLTEAKNQLESIHAANLLVNDWGITSFHLSLIGYEDILYKEKICSCIKKYRLENYISLLGERDNVGMLLANEDVGLMLSQNEAFGRVTIEYMMHGLAVIASDTGANPEILENGKIGYLYHLGDYQDLAQKMRLLIENKTKIIEFSEKGRAKALNCFSSKQNTRGIWDIYKQLLEKL